MTTEYTLRIIKANNGWVVSSFNPSQPGSCALDTMVATDDQDLAGLIAAKLVADTLAGVKGSPPGPSTSPIGQTYRPNFTSIGPVTAL